MISFLRKLHADEGGFLQFLLPAIPGLIMGLLQQNRQAAARGEIEQAEEAEVPIEESRVREELALRGLGRTSAAASQIGQPRSRFETSRRVARARDLLGQPVVDPWMTAIQALAGGIGQRLGSPPPRSGGGGGGSFY